MAVFSQGLLLKMAQLAFLKIISCKAEMNAVLN